jgi:hypothetical protein
MGPHATAESFAKLYRNEWSARTSGAIRAHRAELVALNARSAYPQYNPSIAILDEILAERV